MKDYSAIYNKFDEKHVLQVKENMGVLQNTGKHPKEFTFPTTIQYELTSACNLKCIHCYNRSGDSNVTTNMTPRLWLELTQHIVESGGIFQCILSGGEPLLLGDDLLPIMDVFHNDGTSFVLITNGFYLNKNWVAKLKKYRFYWIQISIDGVSPEYHDQFRGVKNSWKQAVEAAFMVANAGIPLMIAHTVTSDNLCDMEKMADLAYEIGASGIMFGEILPSGRAFEYMDKMLSKGQKNVMFQKIENIKSSYNGKMDIQRSATIKHQLKRYSVMPNAGVIIRPNGDVRMDCMTPFILGNVLETPFETIWKTKGNNCWNREEVQQYIDSIDLNSNESCQMSNHVDSDILLS